jgi:hypothetical protein
MSDLMLLGVLQMPLDMVMSSPTLIFQYVRRGHEAAKRIKSDAVLLEQRADQLLDARRTAEYWKAEHNAANARIAELEAQIAAVAPAVDARPVWIVNDLGELGVKVGTRYFFLYKGDNIEYGADAKDGIALHDDGTPMQYRIVGKREFGETCLPLSWVANDRREDRYTVTLTYHLGLSFGKPEDGDWRPLPAALSQHKAGEKDD